MNNVVFWDIKTQFVPHRRHITSPLQNPARYCYINFELSTAVTMKNVLVLDVTTCVFVITVVSDEIISSIIRVK
jgi:hypothetical protein